MFSALGMRELQLTLERDQHLQAQQREERAPRIISEELFYVDPSDVDFDTENCYQGHPGGVPLEIIARAMAAGKLRKVGFEGSDVDTEAVSPKQSSEDTDDSWRFREGIHEYPETLEETDAAAAAAAAAEILAGQCETHLSQRFPVPTSNSKSQLKTWALQKLLRKPTHDEEIEDWLVAWSIFNSVAKEAETASSAETSTSAPPEASSREEACETGGIDPCAAMLHGLQRAWNSLTGQRGSGDSRVVYTCLHRNSCTSFRTFENFKPNVGILRRLDVVPDTCAMHIAQYRVVSTIWRQHAEYEVHVKAGSRQWICWHRFSKFKLFAATIAEVDHSCAKAWGRVMTFQPSRRCLDQEYLANKCSLLEEARRFGRERHCGAQVAPSILRDALTNSHWWLTSYRRSLYSDDDHLQPTASSALLDRGDGLKEDEFEESDSIRLVRQQFLAYCPLLSEGHLDKTRKK